MHCMSQPLLRILLLGSGGRESALAWKLEQSPLIEKIYVLPGNGGTEAKDSSSRIVNISLAVETDYAYIVKIAEHLKINFVIPGTDIHVVNGIESFFHAAKIPCFGPTKLAAQIEGSKAFAKDFMECHHIPTAKYRTFSTYNAAESYINSLKRHDDIVIKASGLSNGTGLMLPTTKDDALLALQSIMVDNLWSSDGSTTIIEERLEGHEFSLLTFSDGITFKSLPPAQAYKHIGENGHSPNIGGIGCYAPCTDIVSRDLLDQIDITILGPTFDGLRSEGIPFAGMLFTSIIITPDGPKVLDYNAHFGDPEAQTLLPLLSSDTDLAEVMLACTNSRLDQVPLYTSSHKSSVTIVMASAGYPGPYLQGLPITIDENKMRPGLSGTKRLFHAGTQVGDDGILRTHGGKVMCVNATGRSLEEARRCAYAGVRTVMFDGAVWRRDVAGTESGEKDRRELAEELLVGKL